MKYYYQAPLAFTLILMTQASLAQINNNSAASRNYTATQQKAASINNQLKKLEKNIKSRSTANESPARLNLQKRNYQQQISGAESKLQQLKLKQNLSESRDPSLKAQPRSYQIERAQTQLSKTKSTLEKFNSKSLNKFNK